MQKQYGYAFETPCYKPWRAARNVDLFEPKDLDGENDVGMATGFQG